MFYEVAEGHGLRHNPFKALVAPNQAGDQAKCTSPAMISVTLKLSGAGA